MVFSSRSDQAFTMPQSTTPPSPPLNRPLPSHAGPSALKDINYASLADPTDSDTGTNSDAEFPLDDPSPEDDAQDVIGVSIGYAQKRLTSANIPAEVKVAAMQEQDVFFGEDDWAAPLPAARRDEGINTLSDEVLVEKEEEDVAKLRLPSPWKSEVEMMSRREVFREAFGMGRPRSYSTEDRLKKYIPSFNMPNLSKTPNFMNNIDLTRFSIDVGKKGKHARNLSDPQRIPQLSSDTPGKIGAPSAAVRSPVDELRQLSIGSSYRTGSLPLRRIRSEDSLSLSVRSRPGLSRLPSLGDDSRFENVQEMANSRFKAIVDTIQDTEFKFPSLSSIQNFNFNVSFLDSIHNPLNQTKAAIVDSPNAATFAAQSSKTPVAIGQTNGTKTAPPPNGTQKKPDPHPHLTKALEGLTGDLVVLGGYRGSVLRSASAPQRRVWLPLKVGFNLRKADLEVGLNDEDEEEGNRIKPDGMLTHIGPVDISRRLFKRLRECENAKNGTLRIHDYGYDWRLSPDLLSRQLVQFLEKLPSNQPDVPPERRGALVIAHSLGGLITRHAVNTNPSLFSGVVYAGVPQTCVNILGPMRNGDDVFLSSRVLTAQVNFTMRSSFALLPEDGRCFFNKHTKEEYRVNFFSVNDWIRYAWSPCMSPPLPALGSTNSSSTSLGSIIGSRMPNLPMLGRKSSLSKIESSSNSSTSELKALSTAAPATTAATAATAITPQMTSSSPPTAPPHNPFPGPPNPTQDPKTIVTIPLHTAIAYLERTLARTLAFKRFLFFNPIFSAATSNRYPPHAVLFGKSVPTVFGAKVASREAIARTSAYDELAFASGDGVVLARAAMVPEGYAVERGGVVETGRGHVTMLGDLEGVGRCLLAVRRGRERGVGVGG
ncbi:hypothetical protein P152DRAFT_422712, partial [Eremomyces bilateralis CBS 781.70]